MEVFNIIAGIASIVSLFLSIFAVTKVVKINNTIKSKKIEGSNINQGKNITINH